MAQPATLMPFYRGWDRYQALLMDAVAPLTAEKLALQASSTLRPVWLLAAHIISARAHWIHRVLRAGEDTVAPFMPWDDDGAPVRSGAELVAGLATTWELIQSSLDRWTTATLGDEFVTRRGEQVTRQEVVWHVLEHDLHHGGERFFTLGIHGLLTPDL
jgi:uncharacterized damage-inducible protein DinB